MTHGPIRTIDIARARRWPALLLAVAVVVAACANDGDDGQAEATEAASPTPATATPAGTTGGADGSDDAADTLEDLASDTGSAVVTVGDVTYEFSLAGTTTIGSSTLVGLCRPIFGMLQGSGFVTDGRDITVDMEIPPVDWESFEDDRYDPPAIEVEDEEAGVQWVADSGNEFLSGSGVGDYEQDGTVASGTATFVNEFEPDSDPVEGTFEIDCGA